MSKGNLRVKEQSVSCMFAAMRDALWLVERLIIWSMQDHCRCCVYLIRARTAGQKKEDLENVQKIPLYVSRCYYPWKRIVTYPEWLLLLIIRVLWMGHQLLSNVLLWYLIQQLHVKLEMFIMRLTTCWINYQIGFIYQLSERVASSCEGLKIRWCWEFFQCWY